MSNQLELGAIRYRQEYAGNLLKIADMLATCVQVHQCESELREIVRNMGNPFRIAVFGYMKRGKSSIINALVGKKLTVTGTEETTATVNHITYGTGAACNEFSVYWKNSQPERFRLDKLSDWSGKDEQLAQRVADVSHLEFYSNAPLISQMNIIDTPGIGAAVDFHEKMAQQFLCSGNTDALLYVLGAVGRADDAKALETFRQMGLQGYETYNCVGVMHMWDDLYWNASAGASADDAMLKVKEHVEELRSQFASLLSDVVPVNAPLGLLAAVAPGSFWLDVMDFLASYDSAEALRNVVRRRESFWETEAPKLNRLWLSARALELPLSSFRIMLHYLYYHRPTSIAEAVESISEFSGIPLLRHVLDTSFFKRRAVINLRQIRKKVQTVLQNAIFALGDVLSNQMAEQEYFSNVAADLRSPNLRKLTEQRSAKIKTEIDRLNSVLISMDSLRCAIVQKVQLMDDALYLVDDWKNRSLWLNEEQQGVLDAAVQLVLCEAESAPADYVMKLQQMTGQLEFVPNRVVRDCAGRIRAVLSYLMPLISRDSGR